jgi:hypothetical protein
VAGAELDVDDGLVEVDVGFVVLADDGLTVVEVEPVPLP